MAKRLSVDYSAPRAISGHMVLDMANQFWTGEETTFGSTLKLGFLFLYGLFTGSIKCKVGKSAHALAIIDNNIIRCALMMTRIPWQLSLHKCYLIRTIMR